MSEFKPEYDEWGVNKQFSKKPKGMDKEIEESNEYAKYWYYTVGVNVIPCVSNKRRTYLMEYGKYYSKEMDEKTFKHLLDIGIFHNGIAALCGPIYRGTHKGKFFNLIDYDNLKGRNILLTDSNGVVHTLEELARVTIVETNKGSPDRGHVFYITERPMTGKQADNFEGEDKPRLEIYGENHSALVANSYKYEKVEGEVPDYQKAIYKTEIMKSDVELSRPQATFTRLPIYLNLEQTEIFEMEIDQKLAKYGVTYLNSNGGKGKGKKSKISELTLDELLDNDFRVHKGGNKQGHLLVFIDKLLIYLKEKNIPISYEELKQIAFNYNNTRFDAPVLKEKEVIQKVDDAIKFVNLKTGFVDGEKELIKELEDLGVKVENYLYEKNLTEAAHDLWKLVKSHKLEYDKPIDTEDAANIIEEKYPKELKAFDDTEEILSFNGKCYEMNGERIVKKEIERLRREEQDTINRLGELEGELSNMIRRRYNAGKDTRELENYELALEERIAQENLSHIKVTDHFRKEVIKHIANRFPVNRDAFTADASTIILDNGVLKLNITPTEDGTEDLTWKLIPHSPDMLSLNLMPIKYDEKAECPMWIAFLNRVTGLNEKARRDVQKLFGYSLYKSLKFKKAFMLLGPHDSGKSIILGVLEHMVGLENVSSMTLQQICDGNQFATSALYGKMMNICGDLDKEKIRNMGRFKIFVGGDRLNLEPKNKPPISYLPTAKGVFSANTIPDIEEDDAAYYIRWEIIPIEVSIPS